MLNVWGLLWMLLIFTEFTGGSLWAAGEQPESPLSAPQASGECLTYCHSSPAALATVLRALKKYNSNIYFSANWQENHLEGKKSKDSNWSSAVLWKLEILLNKSQRFQMAKHHNHLKILLISWSQTHLLHFN